MTGNAALTIGAQSLGLLFTVLGANILTADALGSLVFVRGLIMFLATVCSLGLPGTLPHFVALSIVDNVRARCDDYVTIALLAVAFSAGGILIPVYLVAQPYIDALYAKSVSSEMIYIAVWGVPFYALTRVIAGALRGFGRTSIATLVELTIWRGSHLLVLGSATIFAYGYGWVAVGISLSGVITLMMAVTIYVRVGGVGVSNWRRPLEAGLVRYSMNTWVTSILVIVRSRADVVILAVFLSAAELAVFAVAATIAAFALIVPNVVGPVFRPVATTLLKEQDYQRLRSLHQALITLSCLLVTPIAGIFLFSCEEFVPQVFGTEYLGAVAVLQIMTLGLVPKALLGPINTLILAAGRPDIVMKVEVLACVVFVLASVLLVPAFGVAGAATAFAAAATIEPAAKILAARRLVPMSLMPGARSIISAFIIIGAGWFMEVIEDNDVGVMGTWVAQGIILLVLSSALIFFSVRMYKDQNN